MSCDTVAVHHCVLGKSWVWLFFVGPWPRSLFVLFLCWMAKRISGWGICVSPSCGWCFCFVCALDLPSYMTTGVYVDVILNCFFSCKDRALERDRPYQREKKRWFLAQDGLSTGEPCLETDSGTRLRNKSGMKTLRHSLLAGCVEIFF